MAKPGGVSQTQPPSQAERLGAGPEGQGLEVFPGDGARVGPGGWPGCLCILFQLVLFTVTPFPPFGSLRVHP